MHWNLSGWRWGAAGSLTTAHHSVFIRARTVCWLKCMGGDLGDKGQVQISWALGSTCRYLNLILQRRESHGRAFAKKVFVFWKDHPGFHTKEREWQMVPHKIRVVVAGTNLRGT